MRNKYGISTVLEQQAAAMFYITGTEHIFLNTSGMTHSLVHALIGQQNTFFPLLDCIVFSSEFEYYTYPSQYSWVAS